MTVTTVEDRDRAPSGEAGRARAWAAVCIAAASAFLYVADSAFVSLAIPQIEATFPSVPRARIGWVATAFMVTQASLLLIAGRLGDRRGRRRWFVLGLTAYGVGAAIAAVAPGLWWLLGARVVQGAGAALFAAGALALVLPLFPSARAAHVVGVWGLVGSVAGWLTPVLGSWLVGINWRWEFAVLAPAALAVALLGMRLLPEPPPIESPHRTDRVGLLLAPPAFGLAMLVLSQGSRWGWASARTLLLLAAVAVLLVAFVRRSFVAASPLLDISLLRIRGYRANIVAGVLQQASFFGWFLTAPLVMHNVW
ncbi:MAG: MFS transporter, partial [Ilumatobacter sp.]|nr:MFS transporter [Ilumatobacter sp.]MCB0984904.1 MFS transporter [Ilumatobacter sp.]